jgi:hypothetical protein
LIENHWAVEFSSVQLFMSKTLLLNQNLAQLHFILFIYYLRPYFKFHRLCGASVLWQNGQIRQVNYRFGFPAVDKVRGSTLF